MKKLFVSVPMNGRSDEEIKADIENAAKNAEKLVGEPLEVIDSFFKGAPHNAKPLWFLGESLKLLSGADYAVFTTGWRLARGCRIEYECAEKYGIPIIVTNLKANAKEDVE